MNTGMTLDKAKRLVALTVAARKRWGKHTQPNCTMDELLDALVTIHDNSNLDGPTQAELTLVKRQLAACQNREKARKNKDLDKGDENPSPEGSEIAQSDPRAPGGPEDHSAD